MFSYRALLRQAWNIARKYKYLWFFGLFASLTVSGGSLEYSVITQNLNQGLINGSYSQLNVIGGLRDFLVSLCQGLVNLFQQNIWVVLNTLSLILITLAILVVFIWLAICSQGGLVMDIKKIATAKKTPGDLTIRNGLTVGHQHFWSLLGLNIIIQILVYVAFFIISLPLLFLVLSDASILVLIYTILFVVFLPVSVCLSLIFKYAIVANVTENKSFVAAIERGWAMFKKNWLVSLEMAVIIFVITFLVGVLALLIISFIFFPLFMLGALAKIGWLMVLMVILAIVFIVLVGSFMTTFQTAAWTNLFLWLKDKSALAKLERIFKRAH